MAKCDKLPSKGDAYLQAVKSYGPGTLDYSSTVHQLVAGLGGNEVESYEGALQALAAIQSKGDAAFAAMLATADASPAAWRHLAARFPEQVMHPFAIMMRAALGMLRTLGAQRPIHFTSLAQQVFC